VSDSTNSYMTRINPLVPLLFKRREARFASLRDHRVEEGTIRLRRPMARWACAVDFELRSDIAHGGGYFIGGYRLPRAGRCIGTVGVNLRRSLSCLGTIPGTCQFAWDPVLAPKRGRYQTDKVNK
jgi:hypothetical protein